MADTITPTPIATTTVATTTTTQTQEQLQAATQPLVNDAIQAEKEITALIAAYKAGGAGGVAALLPALAPEVETIYADVKTAIPVIKAGFQTSEFWIVLGVELAIGIYTLMGKVPPLDGASVMGALAGIYAVIRGLIKKPV